MSSMDSSSVLDFGKERRYLKVSKAGTTRAFLVLAMSNWTMDFLQKVMDTDQKMQLWWFYHTHVKVKSFCRSNL